MLVSIKNVLYFLHQIEQKCGKKLAVKNRANNKNNICKNRTMIVAKLNTNLKVSMGHFWPKNNKIMATFVANVVKNTMISGRLAYLLG